MNWKYPEPMNNTVLPFQPSPRRQKEGSRDTLWAVVAMAGQARRVANIYASHAAALADCEWRSEQVRSYIHFLRQSREPLPVYHVAAIHRSELPRNWRPLPALGILQGRLS